MATTTDAPAELPLRVEQGADGGIVITCVKEHSDGRCGIRWPVTAPGGQTRIRQAVAHALNKPFDDSADRLRQVMSLATER